MAIYFGSTQVGTREYTPDVPPTPPTPTYTSARYFTFEGNTLTGYVGSDTSVVLPTSYSTVTSQQEFNGVVVPTSAFDEVQLFGNFGYNIIVAPTGDPSNTAAYDTMTDQNDLYSVYGDYVLLLSAEDYSGYNRLDGIDSLLYYGGGYPMLINGNVAYNPYQSGEALNNTGSANFTGTGTVTSFIDGNDYTVTTIRENAFSVGYRSDHITSLWITSVVITEGYTTLENRAFEGNSQLLSVSIPASVSSIEINPFAGCRNLSTITVDSNNSYFDSRDNCNAIIRKSDNTLLFGCSGTIMPQSVTAIGESAFIEMGNTSTFLNDNITSIGSFAYYESSITSIYFPQNVTRLEQNVFSRCFGLNNTSIVIPSQITYISSGAFGGVSFSDVTIEGEVTYIGSSAFSLRNDQSITCKATVPPTITQYPFGYNITPTVYVPSESVSAYQSAQYWSDMTILPIQEE